MDAGSTLASPLNPLLADYPLAGGNYDEMWQAKGALQPHWQPFIHFLTALGAPGLERMEHEVRRLLRDNGVTYNVHSAPDGMQRPWPMDIIPLILDEPDWAVIEAGVIQRAELLNLVLEDLYGPRKLLAQGLLPAELIYSHPGFLRACHGVVQPGERQLLVYAADLARGPDGRMWVLADRTQAPSGAGYALENRTVMASVMRSMFHEGRIRYLSTFFRELQSTLASVAGQHKESPRMVLLTPGPHNETYFEHAYLAAYLGYPLVQGGDLTVLNGSVAMKSLSGLQPVDVILRRVDDNFCDPLELRSDSYLGVAGLLEAARRQRVTVANPLGAGFLENPGLIPFLPGLAQYFLNEGLILPSAATWWCGQPRELEYVLAHLDELVITPIPAQRVGHSVVGSQLSKRELAQWRERIRQQPLAFIGREQVSFSTSPSFIDGKLEARHTVLRSFATAQRSGYAVMPGGLTRSAAEPDTFVVSNSAGGISKDTWVLSSQPQHHISLWQQTAPQPARHSDATLSSRAAENLFWVGRYAERAESTARILRAILDYFSHDNLLADEIESACLRRLLVALTQVTMTYPGFVGEGGEERLAQPGEEILALSLDSDRMGGLLADLRAMVGAAYGVRDFWSPDTWRVIENIEDPWDRLAKEPERGLVDVRGELNSLITQLMALAGLHMESMSHSARWLLLDTGRRLERSLRIIAFIRGALVAPQPHLTWELLLETMLRTTENIITYRRRYRANLQLQSVLDLLLLDEKNPRALLYQLNQLQVHLQQLPRENTDYRLSQEEQLILQAYTRLRLIDTGELAQVDEESGLYLKLDELLAELSYLLSQISQVLTNRYFTYAQLPHQIGSAQAVLLPLDPQSLLEVGP